VCISVCLSTAAFQHYCTDPDITWGDGRECPIVVHYWADLQSVHDNTATNAKRQRVHIMYSRCAWFWAVCPILSDRCLSVLFVCPVCLSVCDVDVLCGKTLGWIKLKPGVDVGLVPGHTVLDGDPAPPYPKRVQPLSIFWPMFVVAKRLDGSKCHLVGR